MGACDRWLFDATELSSLVLRDASPRGFRPGSPPESPANTGAVSLDGGLNDNTFEGESIDEENSVDTQSDGTIIQAVYDESFQATNPSDFFNEGSPSSIDPGSAKQTFGVGSA